MEPPPRKKRKRGYSARLEGTALVLSHDAPLPDVCMKCGAHEEIHRRDVVFSWTPVWVRYLVFCGVGLLLRFVFRLRASLVIPLCARCDARWTAARNASIAVMVALVSALVLARILHGSTLGRGLVLGSLAMFVLVRLFFVRPRMLQVDSLDADAIAFKGVNAEAVKEIVEGARP